MLYGIVVVVIISIGPTNHRLFMAAAAAMDCLLLQRVTALRSRWRSNYRVSLSISISSRLYLGGCTGDSRAEPTNWKQLISMCIALIECEETTNNNNNRLTKRESHETEARPNRRRDSRMFGPVRVSVYEMAGSIFELDVHRGGHWSAAR